MNYEVADDVDGEGNWTARTCYVDGTARAHAIGERIVFLEAGLVDFIETSLFDVGTHLYSRNHFIRHQRINYAHIYISG